MVPSGNLREASHASFGPYNLSAMDSKVSAMERAFAIARSGQAATVKEIRLALHQEGYAAAQIEGPHLSAQLKAIIKGRA